MPLQPGVSTGVSPTQLLELLRVHLAVHGEFTTTALIQRAYEHHDENCGLAARIQQDVVNDVSSDASVELLIQEVVSLRLESTRSGLRAHALAQPLALDGIVPMLEQSARLKREHVRRQRELAREEVS